MQNNFFCKNPFINLYESPSIKSKISSQILYGEKFKILNKKKNWIKIKTDFDHYIGYIKNKKYTKKFSPTHKVKILKTEIFKQPKKFNKHKIKKFLSFGSKIEILKRYKSFIMFNNNQWINKNSLTKINYKEKNLIKILKLFTNCRYKWGGKTFDGIDCSALLQIFFQFNNKFIPRDTKDQIKFFKKTKKIKKNNLLFWKGHVAIIISKDKVIHAYGPKRKVIVMKIDETIKRIEKTANLKLLGIKKIN